MPKPPPIISRRRFLKLKARMGAAMLLSPKITAVLIEAVKELSQRIEALDKRVAS